jgi:hypothetical protein
VPSEEVAVVPSSSRAVVSLEGRIEQPRHHQGGDERHRARSLSLALRQQIVEAVTLSSGSSRPWPNGGGNFGFGDTALVPFGETFAGSKGVRGPAGPGPPAGGIEVCQRFILDRMTGAHNSEVPAGDGVGMWSGSEPGLLGLVKPGSLTGYGAFHRVDREIGRGVVLMRTRLAIRVRVPGC